MGAEPDRTPLSALAHPAYLYYVVRSPDACPAVSVRQWVRLSVLHEEQRPEPLLAEEQAEELAQVGLAGDCDMRVGQFSKGMKMRLNFARSLLNRPDLLFLDEPTADLDPVNGRRVKEIVREQQRQGSPHKIVAR